MTGSRAEAENRWTLAAVTSANFAKGGGGDTVARYRQSKRNGSKPVVALARFLELVCKAQAMAHTPSPGKHEYFIAEQGKNLDFDLLDVFKRFFGSDDDIAAGQDPCDVYGVAATGSAGLRRELRRS